MVVNTDDNWEKQYWVGRKVKTAPLADPPFYNTNLYIKK